MHYRNNNKNKRFRYRSNGRNGRGYQNQNNGLTRSTSSQSLRSRNNFKNYQSADKLVEKYSALAKEALSKGDITDAENYFQHADHFARILEEKNLVKDNTNSDKETNKNNLETKSNSIENKVVVEKK